MLQIDVLLLAEILSAFVVIGGVLLAVFRFIENNKQQNKEIKNIKQEQTIIMFALRACLDGLHQQGCNGRVTEALDRIDKHLNKAAHDQFDNFEAKGR